MGAILRVEVPTDQIVKVVCPQVGSDAASAEKTKFTLAGRYSGQSVLLLLSLSL